MFDKKQIPAITELYRHFDDNGVLLYVGISSSSFNRYYGHRSKSPWLKLSVRMTIERFASREEAEKAERKAIREEKPKYNKAHALTEAEKKQEALPIQMPELKPPPPEKRLVRFVNFDDVRTALDDNKLLCRTGGKSTDEIINGLKQGFKISFYCLDPEIGSEAKTADRPLRWEICQ